MFHRNKRLLFEHFFRSHVFFLSCCLHLHEWRKKNRGFFMQFWNRLSRKRKKAAKHHQRFVRLQHVCSRRMTKSANFYSLAMPICTQPLWSYLLWMWENVKWSVRLEIKFHWKKKNFAIEFRGFLLLVFAPLARSRIQLNWIWKMNQNESNEEH